MTKTRWIIFAIICGLVLVGLAALAQREKVDVSGINPAEVIKTGDYPDHVLGNPDSQVVLIEYGDYQCPGCQGVAAPLNTIADEYGDKIAFVFRNFPLTSIHPNALAAAAVAEAAGLQGKYWEMHDILYERQSAWSSAAPDQRMDFFNGYAEEIGLNLEQFKADIISDQVTRRIARDRALADKVDVASTPTIVLNGEKLGEDVLNDLSRGNGDLLREKLNAAIERTGGTPPEQNQE